GGRDATQVVDPGEPRRPPDPLVASRHVYRPQAESRDAPHPVPRPQSEGVRLPVTDDPVLVPGEITGGSIVGHASFMPAAPEEVKGVGRRLPFCGPDHAPASSIPAHRTV